MRDRYHEDLDKVVANVHGVFDLVQIAIVEATDALLTADREAAEDVIAKDRAIDALCRDIETSAIEIQMRQQPVAYDLRLLLSTQRIVADLERSGDLAKNIAKQARRRHPNLVVPDGMRSTVEEMGAAASELIGKAAQLFATQDATLARQLDAEDDHMDSLHRSLLSKVIAGTGTEPVDTTVDLTLIGRFYERFADHAVAIARQVVYLATGELV